MVSLPTVGPSSYQQCELILILRGQLTMSGEGHQLIHQPLCTGKVRVPVPDTRP